MNLNTQLKVNSNFNLPFPLPPPKNIFRDTKFLNAKANFGWHKRELNKKLEFIHLAYLVYEAVLVNNSRNNKVNNKHDNRVNNTT